MGEIDALRAEIAAFEKMHNNLIKHHMGKYVVIFHGELIGAYDTFDNAARAAIEKFGKGPYLIREVTTESERPMPMPASVAYRPHSAVN